MWVSELPNRQAGLLKGFKSFILALATLTILACSPEENFDRVACEPERPLERNYPVSSPPATMKLVTNEYGYASVKVGKSVLEVAPGWSSWWYPKSGREYFSGARSPLIKFDAWAKRAKGASGSSANWQKDNWYDPEAFHWEGNCFPRAMASVFEPMIDFAVRVDGVCFSPGQLKGLSTLTYEKVSPRKWGGVYGQKFSGRSEEYQTDIYPEQLLRFVQVNLGEKRQPFLMDNAVGLEVWMDSVHKAAITIKENKDGKSVSMKMVLKRAQYQLDDETQRLDLVQGKNDEFEVKTYKAKLFGCWSGDNFRAMAGEWNEQHEQDHPDYVVEMPKSNPGLVESQRGSFNPHVKTSWVDELIQKALRAQQQELALAKAERRRPRACQP